MSIGYLIVQTSAFPRNAKRYLQEWVGASVLYRMYTVYFRWNNVFVIDVWYQGTITSTVAINACIIVVIRSVAIQVVYTLKKKRKEKDTLDKPTLTTGKVYTLT